MPYEKAEPSLVRDLSSTSSAFATSGQRLKHCVTTTQATILIVVFSNKKKSTLPRGFDMFSVR